MQFSIATFYLSVLAPLIAASAIPNPDAAGTVAGLEKRDKHTVDLCVNRNYGQCQTKNTGHQKCVDLTNSALEDTVSSLRIQTRSYCRFFFDRQCSDREGHFDTTTNIPDLDNYGGNNWSNDKISSFMCSDVR